MKRFWVVLVLAAIGCGPTREEANKAYSDAMATVASLKASRQAVVEMSKKELAEFDGRLESAIGKIKAGQEGGRAELLAVIREREVVVAKWAADLERRDAVIREQKALAEESAMEASPETYGVTPSLANDETAKEMPQPSSDATELP